MFRREREFRIFTWSSTIFLALIGVLLIIKKDENVVWQPLGSYGKAIVTIAIIYLIWFSIRWQNRERELGYRHAKVITGISKILHFFDKGYFSDDKEFVLFPDEHWRTWGKTEVYSSKRYFRANLITGTWSLGFLAIMDENFSHNYLVGFPLTVVSGKISTCGMLMIPINQMHHLSRKIISAKRQSKTQDVVLFCFRYLEWWKKHLEMLKRKEGVSVTTKSFLESLTPEDLVLNSILSSLSLTSSADTVVNAILKDIKNRFPNVYAVCDC